MARQRGIGPKRFASMLVSAAQGRGTSQAAIDYDVAVRLVSRWTMDKVYSANGKPRPLPLRGNRSFASLARAARAGAPASVLAALKAVGVVRQDRRGIAILLEGAYIPRSANEKLDILGRAGGDFLRVLAHNVACKPEETFLQRSASYDSIGASSLKTLRRALRSEVVRALERANSLLASRDRDRNPRAPGGRRTRVSFGVYVLAEPIARTSRRRK